MMLMYCVNCQDVHSELQRLVELRLLLLELSKPESWKLLKNSGLSDASVNQVHGRHCVSYVQLMTFVFTVEPPTIN